MFIYVWAPGFIWGFDYNFTKYDFQQKTLNFKHNIEFKPSGKTCRLFETTPKQGFV